jgi:hypothetical protein
MLEWRWRVRAVPSAVERSQVAEPPRAGAGSKAQWLVLCCYLLGALALTWRLWADPSGRAPVGDPGPADYDLQAWFLRYAATAIGQGRIPALVTAAMNAPHGINLMWNTSLLALGVLLTPVTLLAGPQASLTVVMTLGFAGSAASMFVVLRRWQASILAAALGGAVYGFSPAMLDSGLDHFQLQFAVLPPLIIDSLLRIVTGRGRPVRTGVWLGLLTAAQIFIGEELLVDTALAVLLLMAVLAIGQPRPTRERVRAAALGLATGTGVTLLICGRALWVQLFGPLTQHGSPWQTSNFASSLGAFVIPSGGLLFHTGASAAATASYPTRLWEYLAYLGWPLLAVLLVAAIRFWRDPKVRAAAVTFAVLALFSLGGSTLVYRGIRYPGMLLPWHWLQGLPFLGELLPDRFAVLADGAAAAVLAFSLDLARSAAPQASWPRRSIPVAVAVLAVLPLVPLPVQAVPMTPVPAGWQAAFARLRLAPDARVLVLPIPYSHSPQALGWQADTGEPGSLIGGWFIGPNQTGQASVQYFGPHRLTVAVLDLDALWNGQSPVPGLSRGQLRADLAYWRPAAVVAVSSPGSRLGPLLTSLFGRPDVQVGRVLAWRC